MIALARRSCALSTFLAKVKNDFYLIFSWEVTLAQEDACGNLQVTVSEIIQDVIQRLVVAGKGVFMEMMHQQLPRLIYCTCNKEEVQ